MARHLQQEIERLKRKILSLSAVVEESVFHATKAVIERDTNLAEKVLVADEAIDRDEVEVEEECLKILALHQPVAIDLRFIVAVMKINNDLERIGDLANNIALRAISMGRFRAIPSPFDLVTMAELVRDMLHDSLKALIDLNPGLARDVCVRDDKVDAINRDLLQRISSLIRAAPDNTDMLIHYFSVSRNLERIADHATNIAEDVVYMIDGEIIRHGLVAAGERSENLSR